LKPFGRCFMAIVSRILNCADGYRLDPIMPVSGAANTP
jgi:hypothetical protein